MKDMILEKNLMELYMIHKDSEEDSAIGDTQKNLEEQVYEAIKNRIICHELKPGQRIIDRHLAEELKVSRSLVRQVFVILEKEELLVSIPRNGSYVRNITKQDVEEIYNIRKLLETYSTELAVPRLTEKSINEMEDLFKEAEITLKESDVKKLVKADAKLHEILIDNNGNERLKKMIHRYSSHYIFYRIVDLSSIERARDAYVEHFDIFQAVKRKDAKLASQLMEKHIENAKNIIIEHFDHYTFG